MKTRKVPIRMCIGCNERKEKSLLIRIVRSSDGEIFVDKSGKANGRGAYLCNNEDCLKKSIKTNALARALDAKIDDDILEGLKESYEHNKN